MNQGHFPAWRVEEGCSLLWFESPKIHFEMQLPLWPFKGGQGTEPWLCGWIAVTAWVGWAVTGMSLYVNRPSCPLTLWPFQAPMAEWLSTRASRQMLTPSFPTVRRKPIYKIPGLCYSARLRFWPPSLRTRDFLLQAMLYLWGLRPLLPVSSWVTEGMASHQEKGSWAGMAELWEICQYFLDYS